MKPDYRFRDPPEPLLTRDDIKAVLELLKRIADALEKANP